MLKEFLRYLWENEDGFFGIGMGPSGTEKTQYGELANLANFGTSQGEKDVLASDTFWQSILSGDPTSISKVLGPEMSGINKRGQEAKKTGAEFGNRGGGTNAAMQLTDTNTRTSLDSLIADLTGKAGGALGASGHSLLGIGESAHEGAFSEAKTIQEQHAAKMNDLFKSIAEVAAAPFTGGATLAFGGMSPGQISGSFGGPTEVPTTTSDLPWTIQ